MSDDAKRRLENVVVAAVVAVVLALANWVVGRLNPAAPPVVEPTPVNVVIEHKPGLLGGAPPAVQVEPAGK